MYIPRYFHEQDEEQLFTLMEQHGFALLVTAEGGVPVASHLPFLVERGAPGSARLLGHMARANPQWRTFQQGGEALVVFQGPHAYVSPSWYASEPNVPTWNYAVVHAYGHPRLIEEPAEVLHLLRAVSAKYEAGRDRPWSLDQAEEYVHRISAGIVAFEIRLTRLEGGLKLSQNRSEEDRRGVMEALERSPSANDREVAALMRARETSR